MTGVNITETRWVVENVLKELEQYRSIVTLRLGHFYDPTDYAAGPCCTFVYSTEGIQMRCGRSRAEHYIWRLHP